jgi:hypothetical protein
VQNSHAGLRSSLLVASAQGGPGAFKKGSAVGALFGERFVADLRIFLWSLAFEQEKRNLREGSSGVRGAESPGSQRIIGIGREHFDAGKNLSETDADPKPGGF